jgi:seryl-tRNA synthetase
MISYENLALSIEHYDKIGYRQIEVPWLVSEAVNDITRPVFAEQYVVTKTGKRKTLIASGEQGFLYLICKGQLAPGWYQTTTPCFRSEDFDEYHTKYFMKNELIKFGTESMESPDGERRSLEAMVYSAVSCFTNLGADSKKIDKVETDKGFDINYNGIEIGSYGIRECAFVRWIYGTGLAEPRFSRLLEYDRRKIDNIR